jgi:DNA (cytosine-5)-methyltransferase 1
MEGRMTAYYNEIEPAAAHVLECLIKDGVIANGIVDRRSIVDIEPKDLAGFRQCHFFAGGGFWSIALRLSGIPDDFEVWTGSCPCQPFSVAGKQKGADDERHLWPAFHRLIAERKPAIVFGEQVAGKAGFGWFAGVRADLEECGYACGAADLPAACVGSPHIRQRLYWCAVEHSDRFGPQGRSGECVGPQGREDAQRPAGFSDGASFWSDHEWRTGADGKTRRTKPGVRLLVDGLPGRVGLLRIAGNAIVPQVAQAFIETVMEAVDDQHD